MSSEEISVKPALLITMIGESVLRERLVKLLKSKGVTGYTITEARGEGGHGRRLGDIVGYNTNVEIKTLVSQEVADEIFSALTEMQDGHALIAYRQEVEALSN